MELIFLYIHYPANFNTHVISLVDTVLLFLIQLFLEKKTL